MNISKFHKTIAITLALLMFTSSIGISMDLHYCGNKVKSISFFGKASSCKMKDKESKCKDSTTESVKKCEISTISKKKCCHNENMQFQSTLDFDNTITTSHAFDNLTFIAFFTANKFNIISLETYTKDCDYYKPPIPPKDITVLQQVFLI